MIKTFSANQQGRDFVIGDLHGSATCLDNLLDNLDFDESQDRLFSVGDLVDRGPESLACLELLYKPWFHAVLSNHEQMMLEAFFGGPTGAYWLNNGGMWGVEALNDARNMQRYVTNELHRHIPSDDSVRVFDLLVKVQALPYLITVNMKDGRKFHIIHAELPPGKPITDADLADPVKVAELAKTLTDDGEYFLWGRHLFLQFYQANLADREKIVRTLAYKYKNNIHPFNDELSHVISGHTILQRPMTVFGQTNIDTGAYSSYFKNAPSWPGLTCVELDTWKFYHATETTFREVEPVVVNKDDL